MPYRQKSRHIESCWHNRHYWKWQDNGSRSIRRKRFVVLDLDDIAKKALSIHRVQEEIKNHFGKEYVKGQQVAVELLRDTVFTDKGRLQELENIIHPRVKEVLWKEVECLKQSGETIIFIDAPLLFEKGLDRELNLDAVIVVSSDMDTIKERLLKRGLSRDDIERRISHQLPLKEKERMADFVVFNNGSQKDLDKDVGLLMKRIKEWEVTLDAS